MPDSRPKYKFEDDATYVIAGGLGGLGRSLARWFARRGAKNLVLLSRRGIANPASESLIGELATRGVKLVAPTCDICDGDRVISTIRELRETLPPIRGLVQCAMVLRDGLFENMTYEDYKESVRPKVQGSWNLHKYLPKNLDFFVLLSSSTGITGSRPQANYASGNTYQDALAYYRVSNGQKAISLDLGLMLGVGFVAENQEAVTNVKLHGCVPIKEDEFLAVMNHCCDPNLPLTNRLNTHIAFGLETPPSMRRQGMEESWWMRFAPFTHLFQMGGEEGSHFEDSSAGLEPGLRAAAGVDEAAGLIYDSLVGKISKILAVSKEDIDENKPLNSYGVDSLVAMEVRNWFMKEANADVAVFEIIGGSSLRQLSYTVAKKSKWVKGSWTEEEENDGDVEGIKDESDVRKADGIAADSERPDVGASLR
jgi:aryl carrier-like protein